MCGIAGGLASPETVAAALTAMRHRGPDGDGITEADGWTLGHRRLAILDPTPAAAQPMSRGRITLTYNGELWNYRTIAQLLESRARSSSGDTEVLAWWLDQHEDDDQALALRDLNGMMAAAWTTGDGRLRLARDRYGEIPLHVAASPTGIVFASELRGLAAMDADLRTARLVGPAECWTVTPDGSVTVERYETLDVTPLDIDRASAATVLRGRLEQAVTERRIADVPVAALISGGIDSSAVAYHLAPLVEDLRLYTAVHDRDSRDLRCARQVADQVGAKLVEVAVPAPTADDLTETVRIIEQPSKAQTEIAWACLHLARSMHDDGVKVAFSGEGSDELWASYGMSYHGIARHPEGWHGYRRDVFLGQHRKNFVRCNKAFMAASVECRLPFLHPPLVQFALRLPRDAVYGPDPRHPDGKPNREKMVLREAYWHDLPDEVVLRDKEAFQTGAGLDRAAADAVADPARYYRAAFAAAYPGARP